MSDLYAKASKLNDQFLTSKWLRSYFGPVFALLLVGTLAIGPKIAIYGAGTSVSLLLMVAGGIQALIGIGALLRKDVLTFAFLFAFGGILISAGLSFIFGLFRGAYA
jgi:hypothetical protein